MWKIQGACSTCWYKSIVILEREAITTELLLTKLAHLPLCSLAALKAALSRKIQYIRKFGKARHEC